VFPQRWVSQVLRLVVLVTLVVLMLSACGGVEKEVEVHHLPEEAKVLQPGEYRTEEFEPSFSFRVRKGWKNYPPEAFDFLLLGQVRGGLLGAVNVQRVYEPSKSATPIVVNAPKDLVGWLEGLQLDVTVAKDLPEDYHSGACSSIADPEECVDLFSVSTPSHSPVFVSEGSKLHLIVSKDELSGLTVALGYASRSTHFDEFAPEAQKVIDTVKWGGS
jgi:hypothetical protein